MFNVVDDLNEWVSGMVRDVVNGFLGGFMTFIKSINAETVLTAPWTDMLGSGGTTVYTLATEVHNALVKPLAHSILALVMLVQLVKISEKMDSSGTMPALKEIVFLAVFFVIFTWLINSSAGLCEAVYNEINSITKAITSDAVVPSYDISVADDVTGLDVLIPLVLFGLFSWLVAMVAYVVSLLMGYARALQLYVMMAFSPVPFALLGFDETRSMGVGFCKNFVAVCIAGAIMVFLMVCFPLILAGVMSDGSTTTSISSAGSAGDVWGVILAPLKLIALCLLLVLGLMKSGAWARDILGG